MRSSTIVQLAAAAALAATPAIAGAAPLRAGASLPAASKANAISAKRAATPVEDASELKKRFPIVIFVGLFAGIALIVLLAGGSGGGRSPG